MVKAFALKTVLFQCVPLGPVPRRRGVRMPIWSPPPTATMLSLDQLVQLREVGQKGRVMREAMSEEMLESWGWSSPASLRQSHMHE